MISPLYIIPLDSALPLDPAAEMSMTDASLPGLLLSPPTSSPLKPHELLSIAKLRSWAAPMTPPAPLPWVWKCHLCRSTYLLGVTRRCLHDGHYFCSGTVTVKRGRRKALSCTSEFDYSGWATWRNWRKQAHRPSPVPSPFGAPPPAARLTPHSCWTDCAYPSDCRWSLAREPDSPVVAAPEIAPVATPIIAMPPAPQAKLATTMSVRTEIARQLSIGRRDCTTATAATIPSGSSDGAAALHYPHQPHRPPIHHHHHGNACAPSAAGIGLKALEEITAPPISPLTQHYLLPPLEPVVAIKAGTCTGTGTALLDSDNHPVDDLALRPSTPASIMSDDSLLLSDVSMMTDDDSGSHALFFPEPDSCYPSPLPSPTVEMTDLVEFIAPSDVFGV
ncbi:MAG: hypothetical protein M1826_000482 [Phylliscum demangeonii]|nr:MAG: hypothetical protein M1826_000482 [Phylliscum demangeonii]